MKRVKFTYPWNGYSPGDFVEFATLEADRLIAEGLAKELDLWDYSYENQIKWGMIGS